MKKVLTIIFLLVTGLCSAQKTELKYAAFYSPNGGSFAASNLSPTFQVSHRFDDGKICFGYITDVHGNSGKVFIGTEYDFLKKNSASWYGLAGAGVGTDSDKIFFFHYGGGLNYSLGKVVSLDSELKWTYYTQTAVVSGCLGLIVKL